MDTPSTKGTTEVRPVVARNSLAFSDSYTLNGKVLVIGLDGATLDLIEPMMAEGILPNLAKMASQGAHGKLRSTILPLSPTAWTSFSTGMDPGKHGIHDFSKRAADSYDHVPTTSLDGRSKTVWELLGEAGGRSVVVNVPLTYPPKPFRGIMITGFPTPVSKRDYTYPEDLLPSLERKFGRVDIHKPPVFYRKGIEDALTQRLLEITRKQTEITKHLMDSLDWNLAVSVYDATDVIGHYFWAYLDKNHPKYDARIADRVRQMVKDIHVELDKAVGELVEAAGPDALHLVVSDHGFGPVYYGVYINNWLLSKGYMHFKETASVRARYWAYRHGLHTYNLLQVAKRLGMIRSIESAYSRNSMMLKWLKTISLSIDDVDWDRTRVHSFGNLGQLYLNLKGREPRGIVDPTEADGLIRELVEGIRALQDPATHRPMFDHVYSKFDVFIGNASADAPDIVFFDEEMKYSAHRMFELGSNTLVTLHPIYSGNHKMDGIMFASGNGVRNLPDLTVLELPRLIDLAPTILYRLGYDAHGGMDGRPLYNLFDIPSPSIRAGRADKASSEESKIRIAARNLRLTEGL